MATITDDDLATLVWCAMAYGRRLPYGVVPPHIWQALTPEWRDKINRWSATGYEDPPPV